MNTKTMNSTDPMNAYGTILTDLTLPFENRTQRYQFENNNISSCPYLPKNLFTHSLPDMSLIDVESKLKNIDKPPISKIPYVIPFNSI